MGQISVADPLHTRPQKSYRRSPSKNDAAFGQNRDPVAGPSSGTSSSTAASTANLTVDTKKEAKRKAPSDEQEITREEVERLFNSSESVIQPWVSRESVVPILYREADSCRRRPGRDRFDGRR